MSLRAIVNLAATTIVVLLGSSVAPAQIQLALPIRAAAAPNEAQKRALTENMIRQMRPILRAELHLIRNVCKTSKEEQAKLAEAGEARLRDVAQAMAAIQLNQQRGLIDQSGMNPISEIQTALATAVKTSLTPDRAAHYQAEIDARDKFERKLAARLLVARISPQLSLSPGQRAKIETSLVKANLKTTDVLDSMVSNNTYLPAFLDVDNVFNNAILPYLDDQQKIAWRRLPRVRMNLTINGMMGINLSADDLAEEDAPSVAVEAAKKRVEQQINGIVNGMIPIENAVPPARVPAGFR